MWDTLWGFPSPIWLEWDQGAMFSNVSLPTQSSKRKWVRGPSCSQITQAFRSCCQSPRLDPEQDAGHRTFLRNAPVFPAFPHPSVFWQHKESLVVREANNEKLHSLLFKPPLSRSLSSSNPKEEEKISKLSPSPETVNMGLLFLWMQGRDKDGKVPTKGKTITTLVNISKTSHPTESSSERKWQTELKIMERRKAGSKGTFWDGDYNSTKWPYVLRMFPWDGSSQSGKRRGIL